MSKLPCDYVFYQSIYSILTLEITRNKTSWLYQPISAGHTFKISESQRLH